MKGQVVDSNMTFTIESSAWDNCDQFPQDMSPPHGMRFARWIYKRREVTHVLPGESMGCKDMQYAHMFYRPCCDTQWCAAVAYSVVQMEVPQKVANDERYDTSNRLDWGVSLSANQVLQGVT